MTINHVITLRKCAEEDDYSVHPEIKEAGNIGKQESRDFLWYLDRKQAQRRSSHGFPLLKGARAQDGRADRILTVCN